VGPRGRRRSRIMRDDLFRGVVRRTSESSIRMNGAFASLRSRRGLALCFMRTPKFAHASGVGLNEGTADLVIADDAKSSKTARRECWL